MAMTDAYGDAADYRERTARRRSPARRWATRLAAWAPKPG